jgi:hypothetical protein
MAGEVDGGLQWLTMVDSSLAKPMTEGVMIG